MPGVTIDEFNALAAEGLPLAGMLGLSLDTLANGRAVARLSYAGHVTRPGGTIAGPALMALADYAMYAVLLSAIGRVELAVTTSIHVNFLRRPGPADVLGEGRVLKLGRRLAVMEVTLYTADARERPVAHVTGTYSIPPREGAG